MKRRIVDPEIESYLVELVGPGEPVLEEMERLGSERRFPIVGRLVGRLLLQLTRMIGARRVFELGSGFGYSTYWFATGVGAEGRVVHTDLSETNSVEARQFLERARLAGRVDFRVGDAVEALAADAETWDIIFCDVDKEQYPEVPALALPRLRAGGLLIFDNVLWHGTVLDRAPSESTQAVQRLNRDLYARDELLTTSLPLRDGVSVSLKLR